ncbi:hypothetical protein L218DRAFT_954361 [Marasmius fiardii PR-910]|nr:hypothetical protein L218DRAFT_954361 [Marasmius fiardii PR-910]
MVARTLLTHLPVVIRSIPLSSRAVPVSPDGTTSLPDQSVPACIAYKVFTDPNLRGGPIASGEAFTSYDIDWKPRVSSPIRSTYSNSRIATGPSSVL